MDDFLLTLREKYPSVSQEAHSKCRIAACGDIRDICSFLKNDLGFDSLLCITSIDYKDKLALVYNIYSYKHKTEIALKVFLNNDNPCIESVSKIWSGANWHEREAFDMMGINFSGHPDLRRILLPDDWQGHPLRKNFLRDGFSPMV